jgi:hypothetical protein
LSFLTDIAVKELALMVPPCRRYAFLNVVLVVELRYRTNRLTGVDRSKLSAVIVELLFEQHLRKYSCNKIILGDYNFENPYENGSWAGRFGIEG